MKDHFVPQVYLRQFCDESLTTNEFHCWRAANSWRHGKKGAGGLGYRYDFYDKEIDKEIIKKTEDALGEIYASKKLERHETLNQDEKENLAVFVALLSQRTPRFRDQLDNFVTLTMRKAFKLMQKHYTSDMWEKKGMPYDIAKEMKEEDIQLKLSNEGSSTYMLVPVEPLARRILSMDWIFLYGHDSSRFITSDHPVIQEYSNHSLVGVYLPLSPLCCFSAVSPEFNRDSDSLFQNAMPLLLPLINRTLASLAEDFIVSSQEDFIGKELLEAKGQTSSS